MQQPDRIQILVVDRASNPVELITGCDIARRAIAAGKPANKPVQEVMRPLEFGRRGP